MTSTGSVSAASAGQAQDPQAAGWEGQNMEANTNGWRTEGAGQTDAVSPTSPADDSKARKAISNVMGQMSIEMFKQQNPTDRSKFSLDEE